VPRRRKSPYAIALTKKDYRDKGKKRERDGRGEILVTRNRESRCRRGFLGGRNECLWSSGEEFSLVCARHCNSTESEGQGSDGSNTSA